MAIEPLNALELSHFYFVEGQYQEAEPLLVEALTIRTARLGTQHPDTQDTQLGLNLVRDRLSAQRSQQQP